MQKSNETIPNVPTLRFPKFSEEWVRYPFYECVSIANGMVDPRNHNYQSLPHIGAANIEKETGQLLDYNTAQEDGLISGKYLFDVDDVIYSKVRPYFAKAALPGFIGLCSADAYPLHPNKKIITPYFLLQSVIHPRFTKFTSSISKRTGMPKVNREDLSSYCFYLPSIDEQLKINKMLSFIDERIKVQNKIISKYESLIKGIRHFVFSSINDGNQYPLGSFLEEYSEKNEANDLQSVAVGKYGIRKREDIYSKELSADYSKNKVIRKDTLIIGMGSTQIDIGILVNDEKYCVSPAYTTYHIVGIDSFYLQEYLIELNPLLSIRYMITSARQGKAVNKDDLMRHSLTIHGFDEQEQICKHFKLLYKRLQIEKEMLSALQRQKAFLLKSMFI